MMKSTIFAVLGLAAALTLAAPQKANAGVIIGVGVGRPAYGYVVAHPRPFFYAHPYAYAPGYVAPAYGFYGGFAPVHPWAHAWGRNDRFAYRGWRGGYRR